MSGGSKVGKRGHREDVLAALFLIAIGALVVHGSIGYGIGTSREPGSGYFPLILGGLLILLSGALLIRAAAARAIAMRSWPVRQLVMITSSLIAFGVLIGGVHAWGFEGAGLIPAMVVAVFIAGLATSDLTLKQNALLAVVLAASSWAIFVKFLGLVIPLWPWSY